MAPSENSDSLIARAEDDYRAVEILCREDDEMYNDHLFLDELLHWKIRRNTSPTFVQGRI